MVGFIFNVMIIYDITLLSFDGLLLSHFIDVLFTTDCSNEGHIHTTSFLLQS